jgi:hypothetical protein
MTNSGHLSDIFSDLKAVLLSLITTFRTTIHSSVSGARKRKGDAVWRKVVRNLQRFR